MPHLLIAILGAIVPLLAYVVGRPLARRLAEKKPSSGGVFTAYRFRTNAEGGASDRWLDMPCVGSADTFEAAAALLPDEGGQVETPDGKIHTLLPEDDSYLSAEAERRALVAKALDTGKALPLDDKPKPYRSDSKK